MPRATSGPNTLTLITHDTKIVLTYLAGVLVECDPSIKAIINRINDEHNHDFIIEDIDDEHVLIKTTKLDELKLLLKEVRTVRTAHVALLIPYPYHRS